METPPRGRLYWGWRLRLEGWPARAMARRSGIPPNWLQGAHCKACAGLSPECLRRPKAWLHGRLGSSAGHSAESPECHIGMTLASARGPSNALTVHGWATCGASRLRDSDAPLHVDGTTPERDGSSIVSSSTGRGPCRDEAVFVTEEGGLSAVRPNSSAPRIRAFDPCVVALSHSWR